MPSAKIRFQLLLSDKLWEKVAFIKEMTEATSDTAAVRNAIKLCAWYLERKKEGWEIQLKKGEEVRPFEILL